MMKTGFVTAMTMDDYSFHSRGDDHDEDDDDDDDDDHIMMMVPNQSAFRRDLRRAEVTVDALERAFGRTTILSATPPVNPLVYESTTPETAELCMKKNSKCGRKRHTNKGDIGLSLNGSIRNLQNEFRRRL